MAERSDADRKRSKDDEPPKPEARAKGASVPAPGESKRDLARAAKRAAAAEAEGGDRTEERADAKPDSGELAAEDRVPSLPPLPAAGPWRSYKELTAQLASRIVDAQRPIRVLQAVRWRPEVEQEFFQKKARELPAVDAASYEGDLGFDPRAKEAEFEEIARDAERDLGQGDAIGGIVQRTALEYRDVVRMLGARGTPMFYAYSRKLYGSPKDTFPDGRSTVRELGHRLYEILVKFDEQSLGPEFERNIDAETAAAELNRRFADYFHDSDVRVHVHDAILSDAAAGSDYVKVRSGAKFSSRDIDILEVHEGWVHVATSLNGQAQPVAKWLAKGPPRTTTVQEGLAALVEMFTFKTYPRRARRLMDRVIAVDKAEDGASFLDVYEWYRTEGYEEQECFDATTRVFRGGVVEGGAPFTKDACYCKGIVLNYAFLRSAIEHHRADLVPYLFAGKVAHEDVPVLASRVGDGVVKPPRYLPPIFRDLSGLAIWLAYSTFFTRLGADETSEYYAKLFASAG